MNWQDYKNEKLKDPRFKIEYDKLEEEFRLISKSLAGESEKISEENFTDVDSDRLHGKNLKKIAG